MDSLSDNGRLPSSEASRLLHYVLRNRDRLSELTSVHLEGAFQKKVRNKTSQ